MAPFQADDNVLFMYHCLNSASGKIDWNAVAVATGSTRGAVEIRWRRLKKKIEENANTTQTTTPTPAQPPQGRKASQGKKQKTGGVKRKIQDVDNDDGDDQDDADVAGPPQVDGQVDIKPFSVRLRTRGKQVNYEPNACGVEDEDSSAITSSGDDDDYVVGAEAIKGAKRHKKAQPLPVKVQPRPGNAEGRRLNIRNLPCGITERDLRKFFTGFDVESVTLFPQWSDTRVAGHASLDLKSSEDAEEAVRALSHTPIRGQQVIMQVARNHNQTVMSKPANVLPQHQMCTKKGAAHMKGNDVQEKLLAVSEEKVRWSGMDPADIPLPSIEYSPPTSPLSDVFTTEEEAVVAEESRITLESLKPGMVITLPPRSQPQILNGTADCRTPKQGLLSSLISITSSPSAMTLSTTTRSVGKLHHQSLADNVEIRPEDSVSNIALRAEQDSVSQAATPTGIMANTVQFLKNLCFNTEHWHVESFETQRWRNFELEDDSAKEENTTASLTTVLEPSALELGLGMDRCIESALRAHVLKTFTRR
ncbi:hypothetical protein AYL99_08158 [Fonsecaea erecta]|uniref:RRM domain-containing protein n=1 Tax=Fonsecaea erecta TaxID=1367422 RepID=A0A178ZCA5_9EURO|nr:hypothetical protein AYL99_08158 [Fonsecaea erecta]OAP57420.1 hypothetical protein AYL99_08158 [Fonsecaea erecta]